MSYYAESPFDPIVDVHWKKKKKPGDGDPPPTEHWPCDGDCTYGWFPMGNFFPGGDGFPPQVGPGNADLRVGPQVEWNPIAINEHIVGLFGINRFLIPGFCATSLRISVNWLDVVSGGLTIGIWDMPGHQAWPPYLDGFGHPASPAPPHGPTVAASVGVGSGQLSYTIPAPISTTISIGFVAGGGLTSASGLRSASSPLLLPSPRGDVGDVHYGFPGEPGSDPDYPMYIRVDYDCGEDNPTDEGRIMPPPRIRRR